MIKVHISPDYLDHKDHGDGGIRRVSEAMIRHLPAFGVEHTRFLNEADIIVNHGGMLTWAKGKPIVNVNHGLYWSRQPWGDNYQEVNEQVVESMARAVAHTAPSEWVARAIRRGGFFYPEVVYHGIDHKDFQPGTNGGYVLWNKARADAVSDPNDLMRAANLMPGTPFWTTIGKPTANVKVIGVTDYNRMKEIVANAGVYLCTARETFGIGTLEAMACGVPVSGWDWGGQSEIIVQGQTGYLAPPGDYKALAECISRCLAERERLSANCLDDVRNRWNWEPRIEQYANIFKKVYRDFYETEKPRVSVVLTACKLDRFLPEAIESVKRQTLTDWELLVIDDAQLESTRLIVEAYAREDKRITYRPTLENLGLPGARNYGLYLSRGRYIRHLDADDFLADNCLALEAEALDNDPGIHIAYGHLETVREDSSRVLKNNEPVRGGWPPNQFNWEEQMAHLNQLPSCVMMRREVLERTGGYRERMKRNEDAEFWCRATSGGFRAKKVTQAITYFHRERNDSKGATEWREQGGEPDWTAWFPWRMGAGEYSDAIRVLRKHGGKHPRPHLVPFGAQGRPGDRKFWYVNDYQYPVVSVVVTVGPGHKPFLVDALDSILAQSYPDWQCVVVNDTGTAWEKDIPGVPWAEVVDMDGNQGTSAARNEGYKHSRGRFIVWMDADDYWVPWFLEIMVAHAENNNGVIYSDLIKDENGKKGIYRYRNFNSTLIPRTMQYPGSSILVPRNIAEAVIALQGGYDSQIPGMEDWDYQMAIHHLGFCAFHVEEPLFVYRLHTSTKREADYAKIESIRDYMDKKWPDYRLGKKVMMCGCAGTKKVTTKPKSTLSSSGNFAPEQEVNTGQIATDMVQVEYVGQIEQTFSIRSRVQNGITYRFGNNTGHKQKAVFLGDAEWLTSQRDGNNRPLYVLLTSTTLDARDPSVFLGAPVTG
ncbi:MAG: glycosyltransferase [Chloroflexi bacterium]|nr:MAG: glycosyltransferase [Chloroflexota bacterium]